MTPKGASQPKSGAAGRDRGGARAELVIVALGADHPFLLAGARTLLEAMPDIAVVGQSSDQEDGLALLAKTGPDLAVLDTTPGTDATDLVRRIAQICPSAGLIALTTCESGDYIRRLIQAGARGCILKRSDVEHLTQAVLAVLRGGMYLDPAIAARTISAAAGTPALTDDVQLSMREADVLRLMAHGHTNKEIAVQLAISIKSIETYKSRALEKLGLRTRADIVRYGIKRGWFEQLD